jgi:phage terminase large subunit
MGRAILKTLKESTLLTFFKVCKDFGLKFNEDYKYNSIDGTIKFLKLGSEVHLKDLFAYPSDPEFDELGSTEYTGAFIDEASQIKDKAYQIVTSRIRYKLDEFKLIPKILTCSNPCKNFLYRDFYKPYKDGTLPSYRRFVPALATDNPFISLYYIENLKKLDKKSKERLLYGNFEYDDDPTILFEYDKILDIFTNPEIEERDKYISVDVARFGEDKTVIMVWRGHYIIKIISFNKKSTEYTENQINQLAEFHQVPKSNIIVDEDGIGGGVVDHLKCKGFINNSKAKEGNKQYNFMNLKSQCYFKLAELVNLGKIGCCPIEGEIKSRIIEDLEQIKWHNPDKDMRIQVTPKEEIKE